MFVRNASLFVACCLAVACSSSSTPTTHTGDAPGAVQAEDAGSDAPAEHATYTVTVSDFAYDPPSLTIAPGDTVKWVWAGGTHSVTEGADCSVKSGGFDSGTHSGADFTFQHTFDAAGTYSYFCAFRQHCSEMHQVGTIEVSP
jgi:plastocyanin